MIRGEWPLVGRDEVIERVTGALAASGGALLTGSAGSGKSRIARVCAERARASGSAVEWVHGGDAEPGTSLGPFLALIAAPAPGPAAPGPASPERLLQAAHAALRARAYDRPPLLVVDDAHLVDGLSATFVHQLLAAGTARALLTVRAGPPVPDPLVELWKGGLVERVGVDGLDRDEVHRLLCEVLDGPVDMHVSLRLHQVTEGNPLYLRELVNGAWDDGSLAWTGGTWRLAGPLSSSPTLAGLVEGQLSGLDAPQRAALEILAVGEPLDLAHLEAVAGAAVLARLELDGLIRVNAEAGGDAVRLAHPIYGEVLHESISPARRREHIRTLAESLAAGGGSGAAHRRRRARWRVEAGLAVEAGEFHDAASEAVQVLDLAFAERCARAAYRLSPTAACGQLLGDTLALGGKFEQAEAVLAEVEGIARTDKEIVLAAQARSHNLVHGLGRVDEATAVGERALARVGSGGARHRLICHQASFDWVAGRARQGWERIAALVEGRGEVPFETAMVAARLEVLRGHFDAALDLLGRVAPGDEHARQVRAAYFPSLAGVAEAWATLQSGRLDEVVERSLAAHEQAIEAGDLMARGFAAYFVGAARLLQGRPVTAVRWHRESVGTFSALGPNPRARLAQAGLVRALSAAGDLAGAREAAARLDDSFPRGWPGFEAEVVQARAAVTALAGDLHGAGRMLAESAVGLRSDGNHVFEAAVLHDLVRLGRADAGHLERLVELGDEVDGDLMAARACHAGAVLEAAWPALAGAAREFEGLGMDLDAAEAWRAAASLARSAGEARDAAAADRRSSELADRCEGASSLALAAVTRVELTPRELEIATMAAAGMSNAAIAEALFVSRRTVDNQLQRAFAKLGIRRRADLPSSFTPRIWPS